MSDLPRESAERRRALVTGALFIAGCHAGSPAPVTTHGSGDSRFLLVWAGDSDQQESDFLAVVDVDRHSRRDRRGAAPRRGVRPAVSGSSSQPSPARGSV